MKIAVRSTVDVLFLGGSCRNVERALSEKKAGKRVMLATPYSYLGDDVCATLKLNHLPDFLYRNGLKDFTTPMSVKRTLERLIIRADIPFTFQAFAMGLVKDCVILADRDGVYAVRALAIVDDTPLLSIARQSGMPFGAFEPGRTAAIYRCLEDAEPENADYILKERGYRLREIETSVEMPSLTPEAYFRGVMDVRLKLWAYSQRHVADRLEFPMLPQAVGKDANGIVFTAEQYDGVTRQAADLSHDTEVEYEPEDGGLYDVVVVGGGTAGAAAAIPGAKAGQRTLVLERLSHLGGTGTEGRIACYWFGLKIGYTRHLDERVRDTSGLSELSRRWDVSTKEQVWEAENAEAGADVWFDSSVCHAVMADGAIDCVWVATPFGGVCIHGRQFIDATGNAELAWRCGAPTEYADGREPAVQGAGMCPVVPGIDDYNTDYMFTVDSDNRDAMRAFISGRERFPQLFDMSQLPGTRERRRIIGEIVLKATDFYACKSYPDTVCIASSDFDTHGFTVDPLLIFHPTDSKPFIAEIPFRALLSPGIANLMTTGLGMSAQRDAMPLIRMQPDVQNQGYVAGVLASRANSGACALRELDLAPIQAELKAEGFLTPDTEIPASDLNQDAVIFTQPDIAALEKDFAASPDFEKAIRLAFFGSAVGLDLLKKAVFETSWDDGWNYKGMGQGGRATSRLDAAIMALSGICSESSFLMPRLKEMVPETQFSHFRAVCGYLMAHPSGEAASELNRLLHGFQCHAVTEWAELLTSRFDGSCDVSERNLQLRELYLAGALHACDPSNELAIYFLNRYRQGLHRIYAIYAEKWSAAR